VPILISILSPRRSVSPLSPFDFLDNPLNQHRPSCVTHRYGFFLVAGLNLLLIFDAMIHCIRFLGFCLVGEKKRVKKDGYGKLEEKTCVFCGLRVKLKFDCTVQPQTVDPQPQSRLSN
jgi:hypothetical protein